MTPGTRRSSHLQRREAGQRVLGCNLNELMKRGLLQFAGPFLDDSGGLILLNVADDSDAKQLVEHDPGVLEQILEPETFRPFRTAFDATSGKSPFGPVPKVRD